METCKLIYHVLLYIFPALGAIFLGKGIFSSENKKILGEGTLPKWNAKPFEFIIFIFVILLSLLVFPSFGAAVANFFYPEVNISEEPIYAIGFYQPIVLIFVLSFIFSTKIIPRELDAPKELRSRKWLSIRSSESVWAFFCMAMFFTVVGAIISGLIPKIIPALQELWQQNQLLVENLHNLSNKSVLFLAIPGIIIFTPIIEELFFRVGIYRFMKCKIGAVPAAIFSSLIFALLHDSVAGVIPLTCLACLLCYAYEKTGRVAVPIIIHGLFNTSTLVAIFLGIE